MKILKLASFIFLAQAFFLSCTTADAGKQIIGKWKFMKFYPEGEITKDMQKELDYFNNLNRGLTIRFSPNGEYESDQPGGSRENNLISDYKVIMKDKLVIEIDTIQIVNVDKSFLMLYRDESSPKIMFRRINNTGTEPGRR